MPVPLDVEFRNVVKRFGPVVAVDHLSLAIPKGAFYSFLGPSGCGKTSSLRLIGGFEQPDSGEIFIGGVAVGGIPPYKRQVNMVFQHYALFPHMDVAANVGYGLRQRRPRLTRVAIERRVAEALALVRLADYGRRHVWELSGGQQQRVALARALINKPTVLLLDEPLAALDRKLRREMQVELKTLQREVGITFVFVTHDQEEALSMSDRIAVMREGHIAQEGTPTELYYQPVDRYVANFIGQTNFIAGEVVEVGPTIVLRTAQGLTLRAQPVANARPLVARTQAVLALRPEHIGLVAEPQTASYPGQVAQTTFLGDQTEYHIDTALFGRLLVRQSSALPTFAPGATVHLHWATEAALALAAD